MFYHGFLFSFVAFFVSTCWYIRTANILCSGVIALSYCLGDFLGSILCFYWFQMLKLRQKTALIGIALIIVILGFLNNLVFFCVFSVILGVAGCCMKLSNSTRKLVVQRSTSHFDYASGVSCGAVFPLILLSTRSPLWVCFMGACVILCICFYFVYYPKPLGNRQHNTFNDAALMLSTIQGEASSIYTSLMTPKGKSNSTSLVNAVPSPVSAPTSPRSLHRASPTHQTPKHSGASSSQQMLVDRPVPARFLRGCGGDTGEAERRWLLTLQWRLDTNVDSILHEVQLPTAALIKQFYPHYFHGHSKKGHPVYYELLGKVNVQKLKEHQISTDMLLRYYIFMSEYLWNKLNPDDECGQVVSILDVENVRISDMMGDVLEFVKVASKTIQNHYVDRAHKMFIINAPFFFNMLWRVVAPMLNENTRKKITILGCSANDKLELLEYIDIEQLPVCYGGDGSNSGLSTLGGSIEEVTYVQFIRDIVPIDVSEELTVTADDGDKLPPSHQTENVEAGSSVTDPCEEGVCSSNSIESAEGEASFVSRPVATTTAPPTVAPTFQDSLYSVMNVWSEQIQAVEWRAVGEVAVKQATESWEYVTREVREGGGDGMFFFDDSSSEDSDDCSDSSDHDVVQSLNMDDYMGYEEQHDSGNESESNSDGNKVVAPENDVDSGVCLSSDEENAYYSADEHEDLDASPVAGRSLLPDSEIRYQKALLEMQGIFQKDGVKMPLEDPAIFTSSRSNQGQNRKSWSKTGRRRKVPNMGNPSDVGTSGTNRPSREQRHQQGRSKRRNSTAHVVNISVAGTSRLKQRGTRSLSVEDEESSNNEAAVPAASQLTMPFQRNRWCIGWIGVLARDCQLLLCRCWKPTIDGHNNYYSRGRENYIYDLTSTQFHETLSLVLFCMWKMSLTMAHYCIPLYVLYSDDLLHPHTPAHRRESDMASSIHLAYLVFCSWLCTCAALFYWPSRHLCWRLGDNSTGQQETPRHPSRLGATDHKGHPVPSSPGPSSKPHQLSACHTTGDQQELDMKWLIILQGILFVCMGLFPMIPTTPHGYWLKNTVVCTLLSITQLSTSMSVSVTEVFSESSAWHRCNLQWNRLFTPTSSVISSTVYTPLSQNVQSSPGATQPRKGGHNHSLLILQCCLSLGEWLCTGVGVVVLSQDVGLTSTWFASSLFYGEAVVCVLAVLWFVDPQTLNNIPNMKAVDSYV